MRAEIINGILELTPQNNTESYALDKWNRDNVNPCTLETNGKNMVLYGYEKHKRSLWNRIRLWLHNNRIFRMYKTDSN